MESLNKPIAIEIIKEFKSILDEMEIPHFLIYGTALGAYRDHDFAPKDTDIDIGVMHEDLIPKARKLMLMFREKGWLACGFSYPYSCLRAINVWKYGTLIDIRNFERHEDKVFLQRVDHNRYDIANVYSGSLFDNMQEIDFQGMKFKIPSPVEQYLEENYGKNWRTPDPECHRSWAGVEGWWKNALKRPYLEAKRD